MVERKKIVEMWQRGGAVALATLVRLEGSSYRTPGARLLIGADGGHAGSISGGCLEVEIVRKARWLTRGGAVIERYSTLFDDTAEIPYGLGCGGTVEVLLEPTGTTEFASLMEALAASLRGEPRIVCTVLPEAGRAFARTVHAEAEVTLPGGEGAWAEAGEGTFVERLKPPQRLFLFGAGEDARPLVQLAALMGWLVYLADGRPHLARAERFPEAAGVSSGQALGALRPGPDDAVVLMTHSYEQDRTWLEQVLPCEPRYLGLLGSRHRSALLISEAAAALGWPVARACERLFSPVGLDLGGDGAEAIALAAVSEIQACSQGKLAHSRRMTPEMVAEQVARGGRSRFLQAQCAL